MRQQVVQVSDRMVGDAGEHIAEPGKRIDSGQFARSDEAAQNGRGPAAIVAPEEGPVVAAHRAPQRPHGGVVVDRQIAVGTVPRLAWRSARRSTKGSPVFLPERRRRITPLATATEFIADERKYTGPIAFRRR